MWWNKDLERMDDSAGRGVCEQQLLLNIKFSHSPMKNRLCRNDTLLTIRIKRKRFLGFYHEIITQQVLDLQKIHGPSVSLSGEWVRKNKVIDRADIRSRRKWPQDDAQLRCCKY